MENWTCVVLIVVRARCSAADVVALFEIRQSRKIHLDTEVWTWGAGDFGQLGHADFINRLLLMLLPSFLSLKHCCLVSFVRSFIVC